ncbi:MAG: hypothetical protein ACFFC7_34750 [Candidatus Hermodarchaeota archaeon]
MESYKRTIGIDFALKKVVVKPTGRDPPVRQIHLQLWDFAGGRFEDMLPCYLAGSHFVVLAFDCARIETFEGLTYWLKIIQRCVPDISIILISTKKRYRLGRSPKDHQSIYAKEKQ